MKIVLNWEVIRIPFQGKSKSHCTFKRDTKNFMLELENSLLIRYRNRLKYFSSYISQIISRIWWFVVRNELSSDVPTISVHKLFSLSQTEHWATSGQQAGETLFLILNLPAKTISSHLLFFVMILNIACKAKLNSYTEKARTWFCINIIFLAGYCGQWSGDWCVQRVSQQQQRITKSTATTTTYSNNKLSTLSIQWFW